MSRNYFIVLVLVLLCGCVTQPSYMSNNWPSDVGRKNVVEYDMTKDSDLYRPPSAPMDLTPKEKKEYEDGYSTGWKDEGDSVIVSVISGDTTLYTSYIAESLMINGLSDVFMRGYWAGANQAKSDFKAFCRELHKKVKKEAHNK